MYNFKVSRHAKRSAGRTRLITYIHMILKWIINSATIRQQIIGVGVVIEIMIMIMMMTTTTRTKRTTVIMVVVITMLLLEK